MRKIDVLRQYVSNLSFDQHSDVANFKCPICLEGKSKNRKRGFVYHLSEQGAYFKCYNCDIRQPNGKYLSFRMLIEKIAGSEALSRLENLVDDYPLDHELIERQKQQIEYPSNIFEAFRLSYSDSSKQSAYLHDKRNIPEEHCLNELIYGFSGNPFKCFNMTFKSDKYSKHENNQFFNDDYIVVPLYDEEHNITGMSFRGVNPGPRKFFKLCLNDSLSIFKRKDFSFDKPHIVVEGQLDALSLVGNRQIVATLSAGVMLKQFSTDNSIFLFDNDYDNEHIVRFIEKRIELGFKIIFWPLNVRQKDLNDLRFLGWKDSDFMKMFRENCFSGPSAKLRLIQTTAGFIR